MRIPKEISLETYIRELIKNNRLIEFYKSDDWIELRADVLEEYHNECQECLKRGIVTRAECVHHVNHVRNRPDLALSKTYTDKDGNEHQQLIPLCNPCHNIMHPEKGNPKKSEFTNVEKW